MKNVSEQTEQEIIDGMFREESARIALIRQRLLDPDRYSKEELLADVEYLLQFVF